mgnify:CR=1 FL=1
MEIEQKDDETVPEEQEESQTPVIEESFVEKEETIPEDIDHEKELEKLEEKPKRSELEKATYTARQVLKRIEELGGNSDDLFPKKEVKPESEYITKRDLELLEYKTEARKLSVSDEEFRHIMWYVEHRNLTPEEAKLLANKSKMTKVLEEIKRNVTPPKGGAGGERVTPNTVPEISNDEKIILLKSGYKLNSKNEWEGRFNVRKYDPKLKQWVTSKK